MSTKVLSVVLVVLAAITGAGRPVPEDSVSVLVTGRVAFVRWPFDSTRDMIVRVKEPANDCTYLVDCESRTEECTKGERINAGGDDFVAVDLGGFGYLSGNHGSFFGHRQTVPGHGFAECDIGCEVMHVESGRTFRLVDVIDANTLLIHPDGETGPQPGFVYVENGTFRAKGRTWRPEKQVRGQLYPMSRYRRREWLDGKGCPIPDGVEVTLDSADLVIEHDVVDPRAVMRFLKEHPGRRFEPSLVTEPWPGPHVYLDDSASNGVLRAFAGLDSLFSVRTVYRYVPRCACTIHRKTTVNTTLASFLALDVTHGWDGSLLAWKDALFYAPRMRPITLAGNDGAPDVVVDLTRGVQLPWPCWKAQGTVKKTDCVDPENMPDRYIRVGGPKGRRLGVALGYSLVRGMTSRARKGADRPSAYFFWPTGKMYPHSFKALDVKPGTVFEHDAYKQYFDAEAEPDATTFYCHREGDSDYVYLDFHKTLQAKRIQLPDGFSGRSFRVLEKTPSVTLHTADAVLADGSILLDVSGGYGTLVLEVAPKREIVAKADFTGPNPPERASCDVPGPFDLSDAPGISLDFRCSDLSQYQTFRFYFKSGKGGVYARDGVTPEREGAWHRLTVLKRDVNAVCGAVKGWGHISGIRIIGDRAGTNRSEFAVADVRPLPSEMESDGEMQALVLRGDLSAKRVAGGSFMRYSATLADTFKAIGLRSAQVSDENLKAGDLDGVSVVAVPYNPVLPDATLELLKGFVARGGKLVVCYTADPRLMELLGVVRCGPEFQPKRVGVRIGGFSRMGAGVPGMPAFTPQGAHASLRCRPSGAGEVIACWGDVDQRPLDVSAVIRTPAGVYFGYVWMGGRTGEAAALMSALVGDLVPSLRETLAAGDLMRQRQAAETERLLARVGGKSGERRFMWCSQPAGADGGGWKRIASHLKDGGFTDVIAHLCSGDMAYYDSSVLQRASGPDRLAECREACRAAGLRMHAWRSCWRTKGMTEKQVDGLAAQNRLQVTFAGKADRLWLCPSDPVNRRKEIDAMVELAEKGVDGIHYDCIRYMDANHCFCPKCRSAFERSVGRNVVRWPADMRTDPELAVAWRAFRVKTISSAVQEVARLVRERHPGVEISAAVYPYPDVDWEVRGQDWTAWARNGYLDFVCPMIYTTSTAVFASRVKSATAAVGENRIYPGLGPNTWTDDGGEISRYVGQIAAARELGCKGFCFFDYCPEVERALPVLARGPLSTEEKSKGVNDK